MQDEPIDPTADGAAPSARRALPRQLGRYELLAPLGAGGTAAVYLARTRGVGGFENQVAVKLFYTDSQPEDLATDLVAEAKLAVRIRHPNVVGVLDVGASPSGTFLAMEYVEGETVDWLLRNARKRGERIPDAIAFRIIADALCGLHAAHELMNDAGDSLGLVHRDFSPQNILVGANGIAKITDFGIAKVADATGRTGSGLIKGRITHMAPEQARGMPLDRRCDVWAAGVVAWELLTGRRLYSAKDEDGTLLRIVSEDPPRLRELRPDLPAEVDEAIAHALCRDMFERCPTADALRRALLSAAPEVAEPEEVARYLRSFPAERAEERARRIENIRALREKLRGLRAQSAQAELPPSADEEPTALYEPGAPAPSSRRRQRPQRRRAVIVALALAAVVAAGVGAFVSLRSGALKSEIAASGAAEEHATLAAAPSGHRALIATPQSAITVHANAAIQELRVDARAIRIPKPSATLTLAEGCRVGALLEARSSDGRRASTHVPKDAREVRLEFPSPSARARAALRRPATSCRPPYFFDAEGVKHLRPECL